MLVFGQHNKLFIFSRTKKKIMIKEKAKKMSFPQ